MIFVIVIGMIIFIAGLSKIAVLITEGELDL